MGASSKIIATPFSERVCDCPFYVTDIKGANECFFKRAMTAKVAQAFVKKAGPQFSEAVWSQDCGGDWELCGVLPLFYDMSPAEEESEESDDIPVISAPDEDEDQLDETPAPVDEVKYVYADPAVDSYDPYGKNQDDDTGAYHAPIEPPEEAPEVKAAREAEERKEYATVIEHPLAPVKVSVHKVSNPFLVKAQAIVYPTNNLLTISSRTLNWMTGMSVQDECDKIKGPKHMGQVYITSSGGGQVVPKRIYHAVVAGSSNLVNEMDIKFAIRRALIRADNDGIQLLSMIPADGGTLDIELAAFNQVQAIYEFLRSYPVKNLKRIFIVMEDDLSRGVYEEYKKRIFEDRSE